MVLSGGIALQSEDSWKNFTSREIHYGGNAVALYFEIDKFDEFITHLQTFENIQLVHPPLQHDWGQRVIRFYDPDHHMIEVGESMKFVCERFLQEGKSIEDIAETMNIPLKAVRAYLR